MPRVTPSRGVAQHRTGQAMDSHTAPTSHALARLLLTLPDTPVMLTGAYGKTQPLADVTVQGNVTLRVTQLRQTAGRTVVTHHSDGKPATFAPARPGIDL